MHNFELLLINITKAMFNAVTSLTGKDLPICVIVQTEKLYIRFTVSWTVSFWSNRIEVR